jgi:hypothetical protein
MPIAKITRWNLALIVLVGLYGFVADEPYWKAVGHGPWLYDYLFWFALVLNGPSGFAADYLSALSVDNTELRFAAQYALWGALIWPQWKLYHVLAVWCRKGSARQILLYGLVMLLVVAGAAGAYQAWWVGHRPSEFFIDKYFWFVRIAGLGCSGLVLLYVYLATPLPADSALERQPSA